MSMDAELVAQIRQKDAERNNIIDEIQKIEEHIEENLFGVASISIIDSKRIDYLYCDISIHIEPNKVTRIEQGKPPVAQFLIKELDTDILIAFTRVTASTSISTSATEVATTLLENKVTNQIEIDVKEVQATLQPFESEPLPLVATEPELDPVPEVEPAKYSADIEPELVVESLPENSNVRIIKKNDLETEVTASEPTVDVTASDSQGTNAVNQIIYSCRFSCQDLPTESYLIRDLEAVGNDGSVAVVTVKASLESFILQLKSKQLEAEQLTKSIESLKAASKQQLAASKAKKDMKKASAGGNSKVTKKGKISSATRTRGSKERSATRPSAYSDMSGAGRKLVRRR